MRMRSGAQRRVLLRHLWGPELWEPLGDQPPESLVQISGHFHLVHQAWRGRGEGGSTEDVRSERSSSQRSGASKPLPKPLPKQLS